MPPFTISPSPDRERGLREARLKRDLIYAVVLTRPVSIAACAAARRAIGTR
jgi:hypothetical protein